MTRGDTGAAMHALVRALYPTMRSITGDGVRQTLASLAETVPLDIVEVPSGTPVFDWTIPDEWNVREAWIADSRGRRIVDVDRHSLHLVNYSVPVPRQRMTMMDLAPHLHTHPDRPDWIPYRTSYYNRDWGFCLSAETLATMTDETYEVCVDTALAPGSLTYGELLLPGVGNEEFVIYSHTCHPSLANDNLAGLAVNTMLARWLGKRERRHNYRFVFGPGTIGSIAWLSANRDRLATIRGVLVAVLLGDPGRLTYKRSRFADAYLDRAVIAALESSGQDFELREYLPWGYDERQFGSPGIALAAGRLTRTPNGEYAEYHSSADNPTLVTPEALAGSLAAMQAIIERLETDVRMRNLAPHCEPQLGRRGLYRKTGGREIPDRELAMLWLLSLADGEHTLHDTGSRSGMALPVIETVADELEKNGLLERI